ncbi:hypothetical protein [Microbulbifer variabilis]|uniref:Uncharacterized protein n=2 Tax=Microbulbifer TaxID=48073 RepID=A0ABY4VGL1_9GAMM|nr:hypothetical protein [Microbulbifer variabilis]USD21084.1 hypothetical protein MJO52_18785 [Microbulbifer variabilis]
MNWKALIEFGAPRQSHQPPIINLLIASGIFLGLIPWLVLDGKFLLTKGNFRPEEILLTVKDQPVFFWILAFFAFICGVVCLLSSVGDYQLNVRAQKLNNRRQ